MPVFFLKVTCLLMFTFPFLGARSGHTVWLLHFPILVTLPPGLFLPFSFSFLFLLSLFVLDLKGINMQKLVNKLLPLRT